jgi:hypothetical protein
MLRGYTYPITWFIWGDNINEVTIEFSSDAGRSWSLIARVKTGKGQHTYNWIPETLTTKGRIRIRGYATGHRVGPANNYIAGDGSFKNFQITSGGGFP